MAGVAPLEGETCSHEAPLLTLVVKLAQCVHKICNEYGTADPGTKLVGGLRWIVRDLGSSGAVGFNGDATVVHTSTHPLADCILCRTAPAKLHNVPLPEFAHGTHFLGDGHARKLWLPFLWGFSPEEFSHYLEACQRAAQLQVEGRWNEVDEVVSQLWELTFTWTGGQRLVDYVRAVIAARLKRSSVALPVSVDELIEATTTVLHVVTTEACSEVANEGAMDENVARALHPRIAIVRAIEHVLNERQTA